MSISGNFVCSIVPWPDQVQNLQMYQQEAEKAAEIGEEEKKTGGGACKKAASIDGSR